MIKYSEKGFIIKFPYNWPSDWQKQCALPDNRRGLIMVSWLLNFCFGILTNWTQNIYPL